jgi:hypothetical protein
MWLSYLRVDATAGQLTHDLAVDADGRDRPSAAAAGLAVANNAGGDAPAGPAGMETGGWWPWPVLPVVVGLAVAGAAAMVLRRRGRSALG